MLLDLDSFIYNSIYRCISTSEIKNIIEFSDSPREVYEDEVLRNGLGRLNKSINEITTHIEDIHDDLYRVELFITTCDNNFRYSIEPTYKANRKKNKYVELIRNYLKNGHAEYSDTLEADDLIAKRAKELGVDNCIIVSIDKDLRTIGGYYFSPYKKKVLEDSGYVSKVYKQEKVELISKEDANRFFYTQMLTGDSVDNIKGLKGYGVKRAEKVLENSCNDFISVAREFIKKDQKEEFWKNYKLLKLG